MLVLPLWPAPCVAATSVLSGGERPSSFRRLSRIGCEKISLIMLRTSTPQWVENPGLEPRSELNPRCKMALLLFVAFRSGTSQVCYTTCDFGSYEGWLRVQCVWLHGIFTSSKCHVSRHSCHGWPFTTLCSRAGQQGWAIHSSIQSMLQRISSSVQHRLLNSRSHITPHHVYMYYASRPGAFPGPERL